RPRSPGGFERICGVREVGRLHPLRRREGSDADRTKSVLSCDNRALSERWSALILHFTADASAPSRSRQSSRVHFIHFDIHAIAELAAVALASLQKLPRLIRTFRLYAPLLNTRDEHRRVIRLQFGFLLESSDGHGISSRITDMTQFYAGSSRRTNRQRNFRK